MTISGYPSTHPGNHFASCAVAHRGRIEGEAGDVSLVLERPIFGNDKQLAIVLNDLMNPSAICSETKKGR